MQSFIKKAGFFVVFFTGIQANSLLGQCSSPVPFLGNDTTICQGQNIQVTPGVYDSYLWDNNSTSSFRTLFAAGTYWVRVGTVGANLITNGDFEQGATGFTTDYSPGTGGSYGLLSNEGTYAVSNSPSAVHNNFSNCSDHTPAPGTQMLIVNGSNQPNTNVWCQTVAVNPNTDYQFGFWTASALTNNNVAQLQFEINGGIIGNIISPSPSGCQWSHFAQTWNSGINVSAELCIINQNTGASGNDFMLDDIRFSPLCFQSDTIVLATTPTPQISVTPNDTICLGDSSILVASSSTSGMSYTWNPGMVTNDSLIAHPTTTSVYSVQGTSPEGCQSNLVSRTITVLPVPSVNILGPDTICEGNEVILVGQPSSMGMIFTWQPNLSSTDVLTDTPTQNTRYIAQVTNGNGCSGYDTLDLTVLPKLEVDILGDSIFCDGDSALYFAVSNYTGVNHQWNNGVQNDSTWQYLAYQNPIVVTSQYQNCPAVTDTLQLIMKPKPQVVGPEDQLACSGEELQLSLSVNPADASIFWLNPSAMGSPLVFVPEQTDYVYFFASKDGCYSNLDSVLVQVQFGCDLQMPNVFSPNSDGSNEYFQLKNHQGIQSLHIVIVNRWGQTVAEFNDPDFKWDGTDKNGKSLHAGTYFYVLSAVNFSGEDMKLQGDVTLIR